MKINIVIIIFFIFISLYTIKIYNNDDNNISNNNEKKYSNKKIKYFYRDNKLGYINSNLFKKYNICKTEDINKNELYIPPNYTLCEDYYNDIRYKYLFIYMINGCDLLSSKNMLYSILERRYKNNISNIVPKTWVIDNKIHMRLFKKEFKSDRLYILKKNVQQKQGLYLTRDYEDIINNKKNYKVIQEFIINTFLINNRKITLRIYLLIIFKNNQVFSYIHKNGKCLYSTKNYDKINNKINYNELITSDPTNINKNIYDLNPLTLVDLKEYLNKNEYNYNVLYKNIYKNIKLVMDAYNQVFYKKNTNTLGNCFQLFGLDYIFDNKLNVYLLEINKGPNMNAISKKDYKLKYNILEDVFDKINIIKKKNNKNNFILIK